MSTEERKKTTPRTIMFGGKAFATYTNAKRIVKLVNDVGTVVNTDPEVNSYLKVCCFLHLIFLKISFYRLQTLKYIFSSRKTRQLHCWQKWFFAIIMGLKLWTQVKTPRLAEPVDLRSEKCQQKNAPLMVDAQYTESSSLKWHGLPIRLIHFEFWIFQKLVYLFNYS